MALMTGLQDSKLDDKTIYFDFDYDTKHDPFWETEFASICHYYIDLIAQTRVFHHYNPTVLQELAYYNDPLELPFKPNWDLQTWPSHVILPYSQLTLEWNLTLDKWEYENQNGSNSGTYGSQSSLLYASTHHSILSLIEPINKFKLKDNIQH